MKSGKQLLLYHNSSDKMQSCSPIALVCTGLLMGDSGSTSTGVILLLPSALLIPFLYFSVQKTQWESFILPAFPLLFDLSEIFLQYNVFTFKYISKM